VSKSVSTVNLISLRAILCSMILFIGTVAIQLLTVFLVTDLARS